MTYRGDFTLPTELLEQITAHYLARRNSNYGVLMVRLFTYFGHEKRKLFFW